MSRFWPQAEYAEEQPYPKIILYTHVLTRAVQSGALVGTGVGGGLLGWRYFKQTASASSATTVVLRSSGIGVLVATAALGIGLPGMMWGKEEIEWNDRSWRLLKNRGQVECDDWAYGGMTAGAIMSMRGKGGALKSIGSVGIGGVLGLMGYMGVRYGVKGGWKEETSV